jgi:outer membrane protein OmpA-like peptidoglycan-associated protein
MLSWLAVQVERRSIESDLEQRSTAALTAAGHDWASVAFDGRDGLLVGHPDVESHRTEAVALVRDVWGVRIVRSWPEAAPQDGPPVAPGRHPGRPNRILEDEEPEIVVSDVTPDAAGDATSERSETIGSLPVSSIAIQQYQSASAAHPTAEVKVTALPTVRSREVTPPEPVTAPAASDTAAATNVPSPTAPMPSPPPALATSETPAATPAAPERKPPTESAANAPQAGAAQSPPAADGKHVAAPAPAGTKAELPKQKPAADDKPVARAEAAAAPAKDHAVPAKDPAVPAEDQAIPAEHHAVPAAPGVVAAKSEPKPQTTSPTAGRDIPVAATPPVLPEHKPALARAPAAPARVATSEAGAGGRGQASATTPSTPRRFETSALPAGNTGADDACLDDVRGAARLVEVHFARGDAKLDAPGKSLIDGLAATLNTCPTATLRIAGHADATGHPRHNQVLSRTRARGVATYLTQKGIDAGRLLAVGYGDKRPVAPNDTLANRARNRRIELTVTARAAPLPPMPVRKQGTRNGLSDR